MGMITLYFGFWNPDFGFHVCNPKVYGDDNVGFHQKFMDYKAMETDHNCYGFHMWIP
jgi:hypothetical protein